MSRSLPDCDRRDIRITIKVSKKEDELLKDGGYKEGRYRVNKIRNEILKKAKGK